MSSKPAGGGLRLRAVRTGGILLTGLGYEQIQRKTTLKQKAPAFGNEESTRGKEKVERESEVRLPNTAIDRYFVPGDTAFDFAPQHFHPANAGLIEFPKLS